LLRISIKNKIFTIQFGDSEGLRGRTGCVPEIQKALICLPEAWALEDHAHKVLAEKAMARSEAKLAASPACKPRGHPAGDGLLACIVFHSLALL
jgi:hypothetical protein